MAIFAPETAYYLNWKIPAAALIVKDVRFPSGRWTRVADGDMLASHAQDIIGHLHPDLKGATLRFVTLTSEADVQRFEREMEIASR